jgi:hypothetical protein
MCMNMYTSSIHIHIYIHSYEFTYLFSPTNILFLKTSKKLIELFFGNIITKTFIFLYSFVPKTILNNLKVLRSPHHHWQYRHVTKRLQTEYRKKRRKFTESVFLREIHRLRP